MNNDTYEMPKDGWVCFHCGERLTTPGAARNHFGTYPDREPACVIKAGDERGLVMALRKAEDRATELFQQIEKERQEYAIEIEQFRGMRPAPKIEGLREALSIMDVKGPLCPEFEQTLADAHHDFELSFGETPLETLIKAARAQLAAQEG